MNWPITLFFVALTCTLSGCKSLGEHYNCLNEVDRTVPAQTQQVYVRTEMKCIQTNERTIMGPFGSTLGTVPSSRGDTYCTSTPVYEAVVLNQPQRDTAYQQCRDRVAAAGAVAAGPPQRKQKLSPSTPFCINLAKADGINGAAYKSQCY